ncbi:chromatin modification-related protein eaf-1 [Scaptodrosophila lebanonensis]|uniref:Chromatin modification-related protein eaf-1 n=1 Tax=Drosophila lebanonensis TaxID=7225 RepID=A0A6J2T2E7_DROLE|nr:chromatin modification-related protein eaf-1 [Scaptodrosophila lebanonensis]
MSLHFAGTSASATSAAALEALAAASVALALAVAANAQTTSQAIMSPPSSFVSPSAIGLLLVPTIGVEYQYIRPQVPFHTGSLQLTTLASDYQPQQHPLQLPQQVSYQQPQVLQQQQPNKLIVHTLGPQGRAYELEMHKSPAIYVSHQESSVQSNRLPYSQQQLQQATPLTVQSAPQQLYQAPQLQPQPQQLQQLPTTSHVNPLLPSNNYNQVQSSQTPLPASYYAQPQAAKSASAATSSSTALSYASTSSAHNPQPYAIYVAGDARNFQRFITTCQPNGQCQPFTLNPGQVDGSHQQLVHAARAVIQPAQDVCAQHAGTATGAYAGGSYHRGGAAAAIAASYKPPGTEVNAKGELRPRNRRTYSYSESQLLRYPYN